MVETVVEDDAMKDSDVELVVDNVPGPAADGTRTENAESQVDVTTESRTFSLRISKIPVPDTPRGVLAE